MRRPGTPTAPLAAKQRPLGADAANATKPQTSLKANR